MRNLINRCDAMLENKLLGTLIVEVDNRQAFLLLEDETEILLNDSHRIELVIERERHTITHGQAINTITPEGWSTYAGFDCLVGKCV
jgi:hypothetical protein